MVELVIAGAKIIDGSGTPAYEGDVCVESGRIVSVSPNFRGSANESVDGAGMYLAPGFIDSHCHDDLELLHRRDRRDKLAQGVTTVVIGNCGFSLFPCRAESREAVRAHASGLLGRMGVNDVFENFSDYRVALDEEGMGTNVLGLTGHGPLRLTVMGQENRGASSEEVSRMEDLLDIQLKEGSAGLSLGLVYPPSAYASREELIRLARVAANWGRLVAAHIRSYEAGLVDAAQEFLEILSKSGARGILSHLQAAGRPNWGSVNTVLGLLEEARRSGVDVVFDMYPYLAGSSYVLQLLPPTCLSEGIRGLHYKLQDPDYRADLRKRLQAVESDPEGWQSKVAVIGWESVLIAGVNSDHLKGFEGKNFAEAAQEYGIDPFDLLVRLVQEDDGASAIILFQLSENDLRSAFTHSLHMVGSDGIPRAEGHPHPRAFGAFPRVIHQLANQDKWFTLEDAIRRMTSQVARTFGLQDRGEIREGYIADLVLFKPSIRDEATFESPRRLASGVSRVWVGGNLAWSEDSTLEGLFGRCLVDMGDALRF